MVPLQLHIIDDAQYFPQTPTSTSPSVAAAAVAAPLSPIVSLYETNDILIKKQTEKKKEEGEEEFETEGSSRKKKGNYKWNKQFVQWCRNGLNCTIANCRRIHCVEHKEQSSFYAEQIRSGFGEPLLIGQLMCMYWLRNDFHSCHPIRCTFRHFEPNTLQVLSPCQQISVRNHFTGMMIKRSG